MLKAVLEVSGYVLRILTVDNDGVSANGSCYGAVFSFAYVAINDNCLTDSVKVAVNGKSVKVENGCCLEGEVSVNILKNNDCCAACNIIELFSKICNKANLISNACGVYVNIESLKIGSEVLDSKAEADVKTCLLLGNDVSENADVH